LGTPRIRLQGERLSAMPLTFGSLLFWHRALDPCRAVARVAGVNRGLGLLSSSPRMQSRSAGARERRQTFPCANSLAMAFVR
jgi:hypothetical protein